MWSRETGGFVPVTRLGGCWRNPNRASVVATSALNPGSVIPSVGPWRFEWRSSSTNTAEDLCQRVHFQELAALLREERLGRAERRESAREVRPQGSRTAAFSQVERGSYSLRRVRNGARAALIAAEAPER